METAKLPTVRRIKYAYAAMAALLTAYVVSEIVRRKANDTTLVDDWGVAGFELVGSLLCMGRAWVGRKGDATTRLVPLLLGAGMAAWSIGDFIVAFSGSDGSPPMAANIVYLGFYPLTYVAVMLLLGQHVRSFSAESWLDGLVAGLGAAAISAAFIFHGILRAAGGSGAVVATNLAYPIGDLLLLALVIGGTAVLSGQRRLPWVMLVCGFGLNTVGDTANLFASGIGATHFGAVVNGIAWPGSILLVSGSVWIKPHRPSPLPGRGAPTFLIPTLVAAACLAMLFIGSTRHISPTALALALASLTAAGLRSALSLVRLQRLTADRYRQAHTDQLTTLANRRALFELLDALELERLADSGEPRRMALLFVDLNRFKEINDSFGHSVGDELLHQLGERLKGTLRESDLLARLGGDEFAVVLLDADGDYGAMIARRISARLGDPFQLGAVRARVGASIGIAVAPANATAPTDLLRCADLAMYRAKLAGTPFALYNQELDGHGNRMGMVEELRAAISERALELYYQPQIDLDTREVVALEALVRWPHPELGQIPPLEFLPLAEDADLMDPLTELVLDMALAQCASWRGEGYRLSVSVNLSTTNLLNPELRELVRAALARHDLPAQALVLEVTETTAISDFNRAKHTIERLRDLGLVVSVDDFGAGFTSLAYLSSLAVGELKLDRSFVHGLATASDERNLALVRSTIDLAHALGLRVVAEGVEDEASFDKLVGLDCDLAQGYLISRPLPAGEVELTGYESPEPMPRASAM
jgi:diguanylate cyclase (GGDEF)-like protein